jgi:hypothetical protein
VSVSKELTLGSYAEGSVGVAVVRVADDTILDVPVKDELSNRPQTFPVTVPTYHAMFVEGGVLTGQIVPGRCTANCDAVLNSDRNVEPVDLQLALPFAGLRYVYFFSASSVRAQFKRKNLFQLYAHLIGPPFRSIGEDLETRTGDRLERAPFGGRVGIDSPPICAAHCFRVGFSVGYSPVPAGPMFEFYLSN